jgi:2'-5' RNA ligase
MRNNLYFIGILAPEPVRSETREFQQHIADNYRSKAALKPPPHVTLIPPFLLAEDKQPVLFKYIEDIAGRQQTFEVSVDGFNCFGVQVIYAEVEVSDHIKKLEKDLSSTFYKKFQIERGPSSRFVPHITIAYKDLMPPMFALAWPEFKDKLYRRKWMVKEICLLRSSPGGWEKILGAELGALKEMELGF